MDWIYSSPINWIHNICIKIIKTGIMPRHVAFIMDGNRRYAIKYKLNKLEGHALGFAKQAQVVKWCIDLSIPEVTVYAFSIENFKRSHEEVEGLMNLARQMFKQLTLHKGRLQEQGIRVRVMGRLEMLPQDLRELITEATQETKCNHFVKIVLNVALAYTAREEMATAVGEVASGLNNGSLLSSDLSERIIGSCLYSNQSPDPDLLIRTSGEVRFSDFLLWQSSYSYIHFTSVLWPELTIWSLLKAIFIYQRYYPQLKKLRKKQKILLKNTDSEAQRNGNKL